MSIIERQIALEADDIATALTELNADDCADALDVIAEQLGDTKGIEIALYVAAEHADRSDGQVMFEALLAFARAVVEAVDRTGSSETMQQHVAECPADAIQSPPSSPGTKSERRLRDKIALSEEQRAHGHTKADRDNLRRQIQAIVDAEDPTEFIRKARVSLRARRILEELA